MVRASTDESPDDKKETTKKRTAMKKKTSVTGVWPCKINGCNKQFAREADLKRHQRTTKLHSMPGFACPQCDATFTRTDALRRHQKSRHNGIVIEPPDQNSKDDADNDDGSSASQSKSRSATPSSKGKERESRPDQASRAGSLSYYRQHTMTSTTSSYNQRPPNMGPHYAQIGLPTSATRLNVTTDWAYPPSQISYQHIYYSPHYRHNDSISQPSGQLSHSVDLNQQPHNASATHGQRSPTFPSGTFRTDSRITKPPNNPRSPRNDGHPVPPVIDPSLDPSDTTSTQLTEEQVLEITEAAVKAVLEAEAERSSAESRSESTPTTSYPEGEEHQEHVAQENNLSSGVVDNNINMNGYVSTLDRSESMEHMLTEDGEPMLNPAELLTQESLASPPSS